jgi:hypothetical protein
MVYYHPSSSINQATVHPSVRACQANFSRKNYVLKDRRIVLFSSIDDLLNEIQEHGFRSIIAAA